MKVKNTGTILCYNMSEHEIDKLTSITRRYGIRLKEIQKSDFSKTIGEMVGFEQDNNTRDTMNFTDKMLVMYNLQGSNLDRFLRTLKENELNIPYKAVLTNTNMDWLPKDLVLELKKEHEQMTKGVE